MPNVIFSSPILVNPLNLLQKMCELCVNCNRIQNKPNVLLTLTSALTVVVGDDIHSSWSISHTLSLNGDRSFIFCRIKYISLILICKPYYQLEDSNTKNFQEDFQMFFFLKFSSRKIYFLYTEFQD